MRNSFKPGKCRGPKVIAIIMLIMMLTLACGGKTINCGCVPAPPPAASNESDKADIPYTSFVAVESTAFYHVKGKEMPLAETVVASGTIIYRSETEPNIAFVLTAKHFCDHKDKKRKGQKRLGHGFFGYDIRGKKHKLRHYFSIDKPRVDACVLMLDDMDDSLSAARVSDNAPERGDYVLNLAAPAGLKAIGAVLTFDGYYSGNDGNTAWYTVPVAGGSSGSGVFNTKGELVGMLWGYPLNKRGHRIMEDISYSILHQEIRMIINSLSSSDFLVKHIHRMMTETSTKSD